MKCAVTIDDTFTREPDGILSAHVNGRGRPVPIAYWLPEGVPLAADGLPMPPPLPMGVAPCPEPIGESGEEAA